MKRINTFLDILNQRKKNKIQLPLENKAKKHGFQIYTAETKTTNFRFHYSIFSRLRSFKKFLVLLVLLLCFQFASLQI